MDHFKILLLKYGIKQIISLIFTNGCDSFVNVHDEVISSWLRIAI